MIMTVNNSQFSNKTRYGLESAAQRYTWAGYYLFVILSSLIGDTTILVGSIKHKAIKLNTVIVSIIEHIAVCDLLTIAIQVLPYFVALLADEWVFGDFLCRVFGYLTYFVLQASILLICTMTTSKLLLLKYPLRFGATSSKKAHMISVACWGVSLVWPVLFLAVDMDDFHFSYLIYACVYDFSSHIWKYLHSLLGLLLGVLPTLLIVATSVHLLVIAKQVASRRGEGLKWQGIITTVLTATVFCLSLLPAFMVLGMKGSMSNWDLVTILKFTRIALSLMFLNTMCNFYIYCLTVTSFRNFVLSRLQLLTQTTSFRNFVLSRLQLLTQTTSFRNFVLSRLQLLTQTTSFRNFVLSRLQLFMQTLTFSVTGGKVKHFLVLNFEF